MGYNFPVYFNLAVFPVNLDGYCHSTGENEASALPADGMEWPLGHWF